MKKPYRRHLRSSRDLVTTYEAIRAGFVALALERNRRATPFVQEARALQVAAAAARTPAELLHLPGTQSALLTAAGVSDKAGGHLQPEDQDKAILGFIKEYLEPAGAGFIEELVFRFLLTRGDALGGSMRNIGGVLAQMASEIWEHLKSGFLANAANLTDDAQVASLSRWLCNL